MNINRNQIMAYKIIEKDIIEIETDLKYNSFYSESDKRLKTLQIVRVIKKNTKIF